MITLPTIEDAGDISGKYALVRFDLNAALSDGKVSESYKIDRAIPTFDLLRQKKAKILAFSHISKNKGYDSLVPMADYLKGFFPVKFCKDYFSPETVAMVADLQDGEVLMFENIRMNPGEDANDMEFAKKLAAYGDIYVNEAFAESHRNQASIVLLPELLPHYAGPLFISEVENLSKAFSPKHPFLVILGGVKFDDKLGVVKRFLNTADTIFVGGALANNVFKELGYETGISLVSEGDFGIKEMLSNSKFKYPLDVTVKKDDGTIGIKNPSDVLKTDYIADCGSETLKVLKELVSAAQFILWNGPVGNSEIGFTENTEKIAGFLAESSAETIVGGGDTLSAIQTTGLMDKFSFVSTGGGAMLDFLADETLPGIEALTK